MTLAPGAEIVTDVERFEESGDPTRCGGELWRARGTDALWLAGPAVVAFMLANLVDFPWHLAGAAAVWALAAGVTLSAPWPARGPG